MPNVLPMHMRALIRQGMVAVFLSDAGISASMSDRIFPNRVEQWWAEELPANSCVYTLHEENVTTDKNPDPEERKLTLAVEVLTQATEQMDDQLDALALLIERSMNIDALALNDRHCRGQTGQNHSPRYSGSQPGGRRPAGNQTDRHRVGHCHGWRGANRGFNPDI